MAARPARPYIVGIGICIILFCLHFVSRDPHDAAARKQLLQGSHHQSTPDDSQNQQSQHKVHSPSSATVRSLALTQKQCEAEFPGLTKSIDDIVAEGPFHLKNTGDSGPMQGRIKNGRIFIINAQRRADLSEEMLNSRTSALHQLHRALVTSPEPIPDTYFSINFQDQPFGTAWGYSRAINPALRSKDRNVRDFLMPHFSFWAWKLPFVGSMARGAAAIEKLERESYARFTDKIPRAVWRGTTWFNSVHSPRLRQNLMAVTKDKSWADVEALEWIGGGGDSSRNHQGQNASNALAIEDFCRYRYVLHTEGIAYSGRFQFLQMCNSVTITPPILWMQHTTHLVKPIFSSQFLTAHATEAPPRKEAPKAGRRNRSGSGPRGNTGQKPTNNADSKAKKSESRRSEDKISGTAARKQSGHKSWPVSYPVGEANIVFVAPDWSDLEDTIAWLEAHPDAAAGIARRQHDLFVKGGYFSPAAEVCYWRALVHGWNQVARVDEKEWKANDEVTYEAFTLSNGY